MQMGGEEERKGWRKKRRKEKMRRKGRKKRKRRRSDLLAIFSPVGDKRRKRLYSHFQFSSLPIKQRWEREGGMKRGNGLRGGALKERDG